MKTRLSNHTVQQKWLSSLRLGLSSLRLMLSSLRLRLSSLEPQPIAYVGGQGRPDSGRRKLEESKRNAAADWLPMGRGRRQRQVLCWTTVWHVLQVT